MANQCKGLTNAPLDLGLEASLTDFETVITGCGAVASLPAIVPAGGRGKAGPDDETFEPAASLVVVIVT